MKKNLIFLFTASFVVLISCDKWTETESKAQDFEKVALENLKEVRDQYKWAKEAEIAQESKPALEKYWENLREYKAKAWVNTGDRATQNPMFYFWYAGTMWRAENGLPRTWLQTIPDSVTCISLWGGKSMHPKDLTENMKKDLEIFHKKGSTVLTCYQVSAVGLGLPGDIEGKTSGWDNFRNKYPCNETETYNQWPEIYARDLARHIIAMGLDGFDIDWEPTCGDHGQASKCGHNLISGTQMDKFIVEVAKYFGPVGDAFYVKTQDQREANIKALFDISTPGFHPNEKYFIEEFTPYLPGDWATKRYYLCADVPCGAHLSTIFSSNAGLFEFYFDKHFVQDYGNGVSAGRFIPFGKPEYNSTGAEFERGEWRTVPSKAYAIRDRKVWGFGGYHGEMDYENNKDSNNFSGYWGTNKRKYKNYAFTRELIRVADPCPSYSNAKEIDPIIITP